MQKVPTTTLGVEYYVGCTTSTTLLPPSLGQRKGLTAPSMSVAPTAQFGATVRVSRDTRINVPFQQW